MSELWKLKINSSDHASSSYQDENWFVHSFIHPTEKSFELGQNKSFFSSEESFRSTDPRVMGPMRSLCATSLSDVMLKISMIYIHIYINKITKLIWWESLHVPDTNTTLLQWSQSHHQCHFIHSRCCCYSIGCTIFHPLNLPAASLLAPVYKALGYHILLMIYLIIIIIELFIWTRWLKFDGQ